MKDLLAHGFATTDECEFTFLPHMTVLVGKIHCLDRITIDVAKEIHAIDGDGLAAFVQTRWFRYHGWIKGEHSILRYDSAYGHRPHPHKHRYDTFGHGGEISVEDILDPDKVPTLTDVVRELEQWHSDNAARLKYLR